MEIFVLLPSTTSSPSSLLCSEIGAYATAAAFTSMYLGSCGTYKPRFIRTDDYYHNDGNTIIATLIEQDRRVYPAHEAENMKTLLFEHAKRSMVAEKAWSHHLINMGKTNDDISLGLGIETPHKEEPNTEESKDDPPKNDTFTLVNIPETVMEVFNDKNQHHEELHPEVLRNWIRGLVDDHIEQEVEPSRPINSSNVRETFVCFSKEAQVKLEFAAMDAKTFIDDDAAKEDDILQLSFANQLLENDKGSCTAVVIAFSADVEFSAGGQSALERFLTTFKKLAPNKDCIVVFCYDDIPAMKQDLFMVPALFQASKYAKLSIFATFPELISVQDLFIKPTSNAANAKFSNTTVNQDAGKILAQQAVPFPELNFFTMSTVCGGHQLEDNEIIVPAVTVGPLKGNQQLPGKEKFLVTGDFFYQGFDNFERVVPAEDGFKGASLIAPGKFLTGIFKSLLAKMTQEGAVVGGQNVSAFTVRLENYVKKVEGILEAKQKPVAVSAKSVAPVEALAVVEGGKEDEAREPVGESS